MCHTHIQYVGGMCYICVWETYVCILRHTYVCILRCVQRIIYKEKDLFFFWRVCIQTYETHTSAFWDCILTHVRWTHMCVYVCVSMCVCSCVWHTHITHLNHAIHHATHTHCVWDTYTMCVCLATPRHKWDCIAWCILAIQSHTHVDTHVCSTHMCQNDTCQNSTILAKILPK